MKLYISTGNSRMEKKWNGQEMEIDEFLERLSHTVRTSETMEQYRKMSKAKQDAIKDVGGFVLGKLKGDRRKKANVLFRSGLTLDMDYATEDIADQIEMFFDFRCLIYSTHKHTPEKPRLRLIIPLSRTVSPDEYAAVARKVAEDIGMELFDDTTSFIMRAFREMRHYIKQNQQFVTQSEMRLVTAKVSEISVQVAGVADWKKKAEDRFDSIQRSIDILNENFVSDKDFKNFVIYKGQKFEADAAYIDIYQQARKSIYVVDDYVNTKTLQLLSQKHAGVEVILFTENGHGKRGFLTTAVVNDFIQEYPPLRIKPNADCHDRLIVLDYGKPTEQAYHCGASSKDAGKKLCAINVILETSMIHPVIDKLLLSPDKQI